MPKAIIASKVRSNPNFLFLGDEVSEDWPTNSIPGKFDLLPGRSRAERTLDHEIVAKLWALGLGMRKRQGRKSLPPGIQIGRCAGKFRLRVRMNGRRYYLGLWDTENEAREMGNSLLRIVKKLGAMSERDANEAWKALRAVGLPTGGN